MRERNHFVGLWLDDEEYPHLREECEITGLLASVLIRQAIAGVQLNGKTPALTQRTFRLRLVTPSGVGSPNEAQGWFSVLTFGL